MNIVIMKKISARIAGSGYEGGQMMFNSIRPVAPIIPNTEKEKRDSELWNAISTAIHMCGYTGEDVTMKGIEVLKKIGRYDMLPPCERSEP